MHGDANSQRIRFAISQLSPETGAPDRPYFAQAICHLKRVGFRHRVRTFQNSGLPIGFPTDLITSNQRRVL